MKNILTYVRELATAIYDEMKGNKSDPKYN